MVLNKIVSGIVLLGAVGAVSAQEAIVKIGHSAPLSGAQSFAGKDNENGVRLAIEELNAKPITVAGKKIKFELVSEDDQADPKTGVTVAQKLIDGGVKFVAGPYNSGVTMPASRAYNDAGVVVATVSSNPSITQQGHKNLFRVAANDSQIGGKMALYAAKELKMKVVAIIDDRTAYGQGVADEFLKQAKRSGMQVVAREFTNDKATDMTSILTKLKSKNVDAIFFGGYTPQGAPLLRQMKQLGITAKVLGGDTICTPELGRIGGDAVDGNVFCAQGGAILDKAATGPVFKAKYKKRYNQEADVYAASYYDAVMLMSTAMQKSGSIDPAKVGPEMSKISYKGVAGTYAFDEKGDMKQSPVTVFAFKNGQPAAMTSY